MYAEETAEETEERRGAARLHGDGFGGGVGSVAARRESQGDRESVSQGGIVCLQPDRTLGRHPSPNAMPLGSRPDISGA